MRIYESVGSSLMVIKCRWERMNVYETIWG